MKREIIVAYYCKSCERPGVTSVIISRTAFTQPSILTNNAMQTKRCILCKANHNFLNLLVRFEFIRI